MLTPHFDRFREMCAQHGHGVDGEARPYVPLSRYVPADLDTPVSALLKVRRGGYAFLLESVERGDQVGRYSFLGTEPRRVFVAKDGLATLRDETDTPYLDELAPGKPLDQLASLVGTRRIITPEETTLPRFSGGAIGYVGYEAVCSLEPVQPARNDPLGLPDIAFALYDTFVVFDHVGRSAQVITLAPLDGEPESEYAQASERIEQVARRLRTPLPEEVFEPGVRGEHAPVTSNQTREEYEEIVEQAREHIAAGDIIQVVLSQRFERRTAADPFSIYRAFRMINPSPYMFFLQLGDLCLVGASPEMLVQVQGEKVTTHPIAGTRPRGATHQEDVHMEKDLRGDEKEQAEHLMLVDLGRNDIGRISVIGSVKVPRFMDVERFSHVMHLVSEVEGRVKSGLGAVDVLKACFPAGTVSGAPKVRAMQIISELERDRRGPYSGAAGYIGYDGNMDTAICIRTLALKDGVARIQAGAGIVADSMPAREYQETVDKARAMLAAIDMAEEIEAAGLAEQEALPQGG